MGLTVILTDMFELGDMVEDIVNSLVESLIEHYPGIFRAPAEIMGRLDSTSGRSFVRVKFRIWPGCGVPIETGFKQEAVQTLKQHAADYADWMISVSYEVAKKDAWLSRNS